MTSDSGRPSDARREARIAAAAKELAESGLDEDRVYWAERALDAADAASEPTPRPDEFVENPWRNECSVCGAVDGGWCTADGGERLTGIHRARLGAAPEPLTPPRDADDEIDAWVSPGPNKRTEGVWMPKASYDALTERAAALEGALRALVAENAALRAANERWQESHDWIRAVHEADADG